MRDQDLDASRKTRKQMPFDRLPQPRRWQEEATRSWVEAGYRGIAEVVTGGGKTIFAMHCMDAALRAGAVDKVVILVPTLALLDQWAVALRDELGLPEADVALWSGRSRPDSPPLVSIMVMNTARSVLPSLPGCRAVCSSSTSVIGSVVQLTRALSNSSLGRHSACPPPQTVTSTIGFRNCFEPLIGSIVCRYSLNEAFADGILARYALTNVRIHLLPHEEEKYNRWTARIRAHLRNHPMSRHDEVLAGLLQRRAAVAAHAHLRVPVAVKFVEANRGARALVFHEFKSDAELLLSRLRHRGHSATIYHSGIAGGMRRDNLRLFRKGHFDVLVTCRALDEGINIPEVQVAVVASATASSRQRIQRLGRVLRPAPSKSHADVYTIYATQPEARRLQKEAESLTSAESIRWQEMRIARGLAVSPQRVL